MYELVFSSWLLRVSRQTPIRYWVGPGTTGIECASDGWCSRSSEAHNRLGRESGEFLFIQGNKIVCQSIIGANKSEIKECWLAVSSPRAARAVRI